MGRAARGAAGLAAAHAMMPIGGGFGSFRWPTRLCAEAWSNCVIDALTAIETSHGRLVVECATLESFDESGVALLIGLARYSERRQLRVELVDPPNALRENLE